jgi:hypothetical protein
MYLQDLQYRTSNMTEHAHLMEQQEEEKCQAKNLDNGGM